SFPFHTLCVEGNHSYCLHLTTSFGVDRFHENVGAIVKQTLRPWRLSSNDTSSIRSYQCPSHRGDFECSQALENVNVWGEKYLSGYTFANHVKYNRPCTPFNLGSKESVEKNSLELKETVMI
ncbi:hypothetical protein STEG23_037020, partial [Scotinomys teguina]